MGYLIVFLLAFLPVSEVRGAIPAGILIYHLPSPIVVVISFLGNITAVFFGLFFLERLIDWGMKLHPIAERGGRWFIDHSYRKFDRRYRALGVTALIALVAIPLPLTGAWSAALAAALFHIPRRPAFIAIAVGVALATGIVSFVTLAFKTL